MILQALTEYYQTLANQGEISPPGWGEVKVAYALCIKADGSLEQVISIQTQQQMGNKTVLAPQLIELPAPVKRASGIAANFLCDNSSYLLGVDNKGKPQRALNCFEACKKLHEKLLEQIDSPAARATLAFFQNWHPEQAATHSALAHCLDEIQSGVNLVFRFDGIYVHQDPLIQKAWDTYYQTAKDGPSMVCLVTGKQGPVESIHPSIKNVYGAQTSGAALVSFNAPAFCSYGKEQNLNAPTSKYAAFAYTTALNHLLSNRKYVYRVGDATVVCWAKCGGNIYQDLMAWVTFEQTEPSYYTSNELKEALKNLCAGNVVELNDEQLDPNMEFYILGLSPNAARLSVRFFLRDSFGSFLQNVRAHQKRLEIIRPFNDKFDMIPLCKLLSETVNQNSRDKTPAPNMSGEVLRSILTNTRYPASLLNGVVLRLRAEHTITAGKAAILKAYYLKNPHPDVPKEVLTVSLNPNSSNLPYNLGRLFSVLEAIQIASNPGINATIKDKYFNSASATPAMVFPVLLNLAQKHLKKLDPSLRSYYDRQIVTILSNLGENYPAHLNLPQQGSFQLGYYHQTQEAFKKKEEK